MNSESPFLVSIRVPPSVRSKAARMIRPTLYGLFLFLAVASVAGAEPQRATHDSLDGKVFTGYQGWFAPKDENGKAIWRHLGKRNRFEPEFCGIDLWPDVAELAPDELFPTGFK